MKVNTMMKLNVGVSRKIGLPGYGSAGASCQIELELASGLLVQDPEAFHDQVRRAYAAAHQAVDDDLAQFQAQPKHAMRINGHARREGRWPIVDATNGDGDAAPPCCRATARQLQAISTIARRREIDLEDLLLAFDVDRPEELTVAQASSLIDRLRAAAAV